MTESDRFSWRASQAEASQNGRRSSAFRFGLIIVLAGAGLAALSWPSDLHSVSAQAQSGAPPAPAGARAPRLIVDIAIQAKPGEKPKLPVRVEPMPSGTAQFLMLHQVPPWLKVGGAESVGAGVWLLQLADLPKADLQFGEGASGRHEIAVALLAPNGREVQSESKLLVTVGAASASTEPPRTWQSLVGKNSGAVPAPPRAASQSASPAASKKTQANENDMIQQARYLVRDCTTCHSLFGTDNGIPVMVGLSRERFLDTMRLYKTGKRDHGPMHAVANSLDDEEMMALAVYLGRIRPAAPEAPRAAADAASGATAIAPAIRLKAQGVAPGDGDRVDRWIKRGKQFLSAGEIAQARLMFERAAELGSTSGAYHLGTTFDPNVLPWRPGMGLEAEPLRARQWYQAALQLGPMPEAQERLSELK